MTTILKTKLRASAQSVHSVSGKTKTKIQEKPLDNLNSFRDDTPPQVGETCEVTPDSLTRGDTGAYQKSVKLGRTFLDDEVAFL